MPFASSIRQPDADHSHASHILLLVLIPFSTQSHLKPGTRFSHAIFYMQGQWLQTTGLAKIQAKYYPIDG